MALKYLDFPPNLGFHVSKEKSEFVKEFKKILNGLGIGWADACCPNQIATAGAPLTAVGVGTTLGITNVKNSIVIGKAPVFNRVAVAANVTQTLSVGGLSGGLITSTSPAAVSLTLPSATALVDQLGATRGGVFEFIIDNTAGANTVTVVLPGSITVLPTIVITGEDVLTVAAGSVGFFRLFFKTLIAANIIRTS